MAAGAAGVAIAAVAAITAVPTPLLHQGLMLLKQNNSAKHISYIDY